MTQYSNGSFFNDEHKIKIINKKRVCVCIGHFCDLDGISEYEYLQRKLGRDSS